MADKQEFQEIFSKKVRAGRRTYFFDVRSTKADDYYMTITESVKDTNDEAVPSYRKHKIFLYKEDFNNYNINLGFIKTKPIEFEWWNLSMVHLLMVFDKDELHRMLNAYEII